MTNASWQNGKVRWQNVKLTKCQVDKMSSWLNGNVTKCLVDKNGKNDKMSSWQNDKFS